LVVNKWDLVPQAERREFQRHLEQRLKFMSYVPILYVSAKLRQGIDRILPQAWQVWQERQKKLPRSVVDTVVKEAVSSHAPPRIGTRQLHITQAYQDESRLATFVLQVNDPKLVHFSYQRYLENKLRHKFGFRGVPLRLVFTRATPKSNKKIKVARA
jgi:GTP-binding protein